MRLYNIHILHLYDFEDALQHTLLAVTQAGYLNTYNLSNTSKMYILINTTMTTQVMKMAIQSHLRPQDCTQ